MLNFIKISLNLSSIVHISNNHCIMKYNYLFYCFLCSYFNSVIIILPFILTMSSIIVLRTNHIKFLFICDSSPGSLLYFQFFIHSFTSFHQKIFIGKYYKLLYYSRVFISGINKSES